MIDRLTHEFAKGNPVVTKILEKYEVYIMPLVNPDGYDYTQKKVKT